jgi:glycosyltransferase involved in cell wall biosynthesis
MVVVIPVCAKDEALVLKNLDWLAELDGTVDAHAVISHPHGFKPTCVVERAKGIFNKISESCYGDWAGNPAWPHPQNWAFQSAARGIVKHQQPWFWWESDSCPIAKGWYGTLRDEYADAKQPFMGCIVEEDSGNGTHMNGVGVYPPDVGTYSVNAMLCRASPFDIVAWKDVQHRCHRANHLIQQVAFQNGDSQTFDTQQDVQRIIRPGVVFFHRCKDGSLIDRLREAKPKGLLSRLFISPPKPKVKKVIPLIAHIDSSSGYGILSSQIALEFLKMDYDVQIFPASYNEIHGAITPELKRCIRGQSNPHPWDLVIYPCVIQPANLVLGNKYHAMYSMWEAARLVSKIDMNRTKAVEVFNRCKVAITPNAWNASSFSSCGVDTPIRICPMGFDPEVFPLAVNDVSGKLVFGTAAKTASGGIRKGFNIVVEAFRLAFPREKNVKLKVKSFSEDPPVDDFKDSRIEVLQRYIDQKELVEWYRSINVFVSGSAAEGWGRHQHEAMAMGRPVIGVDFGGVCEFFSRENGYAVGFTLVPAEGIYESMGVYAKPLVESMAAQMRKAYENRVELQNKSEMAAASAREFTVERSANTLIEILREFHCPV